MAIGERNVGKTLGDQAKEVVGAIGVLDNDVRIKLNVLDAYPHGRPTEEVAIGLHNVGVRLGDQAGEDVGIFPRPPEACGMTKPQARCASCLYPSRGHARQRCLDRPLRRRTSWVKGGGKGQREGKGEQEQARQRLTQPCDPRVEEAHWLLCDALDWTDISADDACVIRDLMRQQTRLRVSIADEEAAAWTASPDLQGAAPLDPIGMCRAFLACHLIFRWVARLGWVTWRWPVTRTRWWWPPAVTPAMSSSHA